MRSSHNRKYITLRTSMGRTLHRTWKIWWRDRGYSSYASAEEAYAVFDENQKAVRLDRVDITILKERE